MSHANPVFSSFSFRYWSVFAGLCLALLGTGACAFEPPAEGWSRWRVQTVADAPAWCCFDHRDGSSEPTVCRLDQRGRSYGSQRGSSGAGAAVIHARMEAGRLTAVRALAPSCEATASTSIADLGDIDADLSASWLAARLQLHSALSSDLYAALALHAGERARAVLYHSARADPQIDQRKDALFWLGQTRAKAAAPLILELMGDSDAELREHAAFVVAVSDVPGNIGGLIKQGRGDASAEVRGQAWFWLAQTADLRAEVAITDALAVERDPEVRDHMIFALSQLPDERASAALIELLSDRQADRGTREQALFWLGQSDSEIAQNYLERLLVGE